MPPVGMSDVNGTVVKIQGRDVVSTAPSDRDVLTWDAANSRWQPEAPPQPMEAWVGTVNSQSQVIQRIPWTCRTTGTSWVSTGVMVSISTDKAVSMYAYGVFRHPSSVAGVYSLATLLVVANNGGTLTTPNSANLANAISGTMAATGNASFRIAVSGTTATLEVSFPTAGGGTTVDCQGFVDLMLV